jgi:DNA-binding FrmR family transcriptional regulator
MSHAARNKDKLIARVRRLQGQLEGVERALEADAECAEIMRQLASIRGAMTGLNAEVIEEHIREHVLAADAAKARQLAGEELIEVIRTYLK